MTGKIPPKVLCRVNEVTINIYGYIFVEEFIIIYTKMKSSKKSQSILDEGWKDLIFKLSRFIIKRQIDQNF